MTCKDCIHKDLCKDDYELGYLFKDENGNYFTDDCEHFKNKADFVEVVRCRNCKFAYKNRFLGEFYCEKTYHKIKQIHFCGEGKRK